ncbi:bacteriocin immunity protein [Lactiplantibacillus plantarum]|uniref:bacteriocin immunity protein n=1 Tax=Lactiplantibacillus plantarum TaxID=1590 RepID=UPI00217E3049|nr:bacteriocin immunity protein [Lactiplantibacillus plantarum]MCS6155672.1 bacteriocin immunity protein [Lactiplantibacillus plantarum]
MLKNENAIALIRAIDVAYSDPELQQALAKAAQDLDCVADHHQVANRLNQLLTTWGARHSQGPAVLDQLYLITLKDGVDVPCQVPYRA